MTDEPTDKARATDDEMTKFAEACVAGKTAKRAELAEFMRAYLDRAARPSAPASFLPSALATTAASTADVATIPMPDPFAGRARCPTKVRDMGGGAVHLSIDANRTYTRGEALGLAHAVYTIAAASTVE